MSKFYFSRRSPVEKNNFLVRNVVEKLVEEIEKIAKFKTYVRLVTGDNSAQNIPIYKAKTFIYKNMCDILCKILDKYS
jgi:hypothetical protein